MLALTGATGYLGQALLPALQTLAQPLLTLGRRDVSRDGATRPYRHLDLSGTGGFRDALAGVETLVHLAGVAHHRGSPSAYDAINRRATLALADAALAVGCRRFVFVSSLNIVPAGAPDAQVAAAGLPCPSDRYSRSKWDAEQQLEALLQGAGIELVIVRPALVYDRELVASLATLQHMLARWPLRLPAVGRRSMIARPDLVAVLLRAVTEPLRPRAVERLAVTDGECYDLCRIGSVFRQSGIAVPSVAVRGAALCRDVLGGLAIGTSWRGLAADKWVGPLPQLPCSVPEHTLESLWRCAS